MSPAVAKQPDPRDRGEANPTRPAAGDQRELRRNRLDDRRPCPLVQAAGALVLLAHGTGHLLRDRGASPARPLDRILAGRPASAEQAGRLPHGGSGPRTSLLCGGFALDPGLPQTLLDLLPPLFV